MKNIKTIFLKELKRIFTDYRMVLALFLPGILIFFLYEFMGNTLNAVVSDTTPKNATYEIVYTDNSGNGKNPLLCQYFEGYILAYEKTNTADFTMVSASSDSVTAAKSDVTAGKYDVFIEFTDGFETKVSQAQDKTAYTNVTLRYNGANSRAYHAYSILNSLIPAIYDNYTQNIDSSGKAVTANIGVTDATVNRIIGFIFPMVTVSMLFSAVMSITPEAIAGEKERGTIASLLLTPVRHSEIAIGKILALSVTAILSGLTSFLGLLFSLPDLVGAKFFSISLGSGCALFFLIITALLLFVSLGTVLSAFAKSIREANSYLGPVMSIMMVLSFLPSFLDCSSIGYAFIPFFDISSSMYLIISGNATPYVYLGITIGMNLLLSAFFIFLTNKLFDNEKIMFSR
jgi:sodium transport system permease protein